MRIYNYLFYKTFLLAIRSRNFNDFPVLGGILFVVACLMFNIFTIAIFLEGLGILHEYPFSENLKYPFSFALLIIVLVYYLYHNRYKRIVEDFNQKYKDRSQLHPVIVVLIYYIISFGLLLLAGLFKNHDWIFSTI